MSTVKSLSSVAEDYFHNLNPLARRIADDIEATKDAYEGLWNTLSLKEKNQAIDETIIQPEIALKYAVGDLGRDMPDWWYPRLRIQTGLRHVIDETGSTLRWKDEHSGPFSFMTRSQMDLSLFAASDAPRIKSLGTYGEDSPHFTSPIHHEESSFESNSLNDYTISSNPTNFYQSESYSDSVFKNPDSSRSSSQPNDNIFTKMMNKTSFLKMGNNDDDERESLVPQINASRSAPKIDGNKPPMNINLTSGSKPKSGYTNESTALLETPSPYSSFQSNQTNQDDGIPKTGFEFLDNW